MGAKHRLDAVGDQFPRGEGVLHAGMAHRDPVVDPDGVEFERHAARGAHRGADLLPDHVEVRMAGHDLHEGIGDRDERLVPIGFGLDHSRSAEEAAVRGAEIAALDGIAEGHAPD